ncbi:hypothetical protein BJ912DRAFT_1047229 [Pholiota molesta]|nr:hypothetical protein BJ912DRAFT_1047229 [Pholiota molesta]
MAQDFSNASHVNINNLTTSHANGNAVPVGRLVESERQGFRMLLDNISRGAFHNFTTRGDPPRASEGILPAFHSEQRSTSTESGPQSLDYLPCESDETEKTKKRRLFWGGRHNDRDKEKERKRLDKETHDQGVLSRDQERGGREARREDDGFAELSGIIGYLIATASKDGALLLEVCERASASENNAREAVQALRRDLKYGEPSVQLGAARLWAILLRNSSSTFISECTTYKFLYTIEDLLSSSETAPVVKERLLEIVAAAAYASGRNHDPDSGCDDGFKGLWKRVKPSDKPDEVIILLALLSIILTLSLRAGRALFNLCRRHIRG